MKKIFLVISLVLSMILNSSFAFALNINENVSINSHINQEIFEYILFDYNFLTGNTNVTSQNIFDNLKENYITANEIKFIKSLNINEETNEGIILYIQSNYDTLVNEMTIEEKEVFDKYLLEVSLQYYYNILGSDFEYNEIMTDINEANDTNSVNESSVVSMKVCSDPSNVNGSVSGTGMEISVGHHSWIQIFNHTTQTLTVGGLELPSLKGVTIGTWHGNVHDGIWYNLEDFYEHEFSTTQSVLATQSLTQTQLNTLTNNLKRSSNDDWSLGNNCSSFAARMWNLFSDYDVSAGIIPTPINLANSIVDDAGGYQSLSMPSTVSEVFYGGANPESYITY